MPADPPAARSRLATLVWPALLLGAAAPFLVTFAERIVDVLGTTWSRDYGEGCVLAMQQLLSERGHYFPMYSDYPFVHGNYPPVFILLSLPSWWILGPNLLAPRLVSVAATLGLLVCIYALLRRLGTSRTSALAGPLLVATPWFVQTWAPLARVDMLSCLFSVLGLLVYERTSQREGVVRYAALSLFWLAFFTKQNALLAPAAVLLHGLLVPGGRRRAASDALVFSGGLALLLGLLVGLTGGGAWRHLVPFTAAATYEWDRMFKLGKDFLLLSGPLLAAAAGALAVGPLRLLSGGEGRYVLYLGLNLAAIVTVAKAGAAQNYLIEPWVALVIASLLLLDRLVVESPRIAPLVPAMAIVALLVAGVADRERMAKRAAATQVGDRAEFAELTALLQAAPGPVLSENLTAVVLARKPVLVEPFGLGLISTKGLASAEPVLADCRARRFGLVVYEFRLREIAGLEACLGENYELLKHLGPYAVLVPKR